MSGTSIAPEIDRVRLVHRDTRRVETLTFAEARIAHGGAP